MQPLNIQCSDSQQKTKNTTDISETIIQSSFTPFSQHDHNILPDPHMKYLYFQFQLCAL